ncbi:MAG TPA: GNAT family N-acetyltransferase [Caulobacteraceae bacterium]|nr:GNAT family N-acetyltransferase [Caulobacteraceae bacterium]
MTGGRVDPARLEPVTARAWRAAEETSLGGWRLNASRGVSGRINACWPIAAPGRPAAAALAEVEAWYAARGLPARFKIVDGLCEPADLAERLGASGYRSGKETLVMTGPIAARADARVQVLDEPDERFASVFAGASTDPLDTQERLEALARTPAPRGFALAELAGEPAAIGACAIDSPWVGIFAMRTLPEFRRQGLARDVLDSLLAKAAALGATSAWLQVEADNAAARWLYEAAGFEEAYRYRYWARA